MIISGHQHIKFNILLGYWEGPHLPDPCAQRGEVPADFPAPRPCWPAPWHIPECLCPLGMHLLRQVPKCLCPRGLHFYLGAIPCRHIPASPAAAHPAVRGRTPVTCPQAQVEDRTACFGIVPVTQPAFIPAAVSAGWDPAAPRSAPLRTDAKSHPSHVAKQAQASRSRSGQKAAGGGLRPCSLS